MLLETKQILLPVLSVAKTTTDRSEYERCIRIIHCIILMKILQWKKAYQPIKKYPRGLLIDIKV